jgi:hypothetical protein
MLSRAYTDAFNDNMMMSGTDLGFNVTNAPTNSYTPSQQIMYQKNGGLWANIHAKRKRIKEGSGEKMRKPGSKGAPTDEALKRSQMEMGGTRVPGGMIKPISNTAVEFVGKTHEQGGIMLDPQTEVEGGETMDKVMMSSGGNSDYIFSDHLKLGGVTFATRHKNMLKAGASKQDIQQLAKMQESVAAKEGANENGPRSPQRIAKLGGVRKYQTAGEYMDPDAPQVNIPTFGMFPSNYFGLGRLDYQVAEELAKRKGGNAAMYLAGADTIAHHESGPHERMATNAWQGGSETLPGKGTFQIEGSQHGGSNTLETAQNHLGRTMGYWGHGLPSRIANATDASTLSYEDQRALALAHLLQGPVPMADYASGDINIGDVWAKGWKKSGANLDSFENSRVDAQTNGIPQTNYVEREHKTGGVRKYQEGDVLPNNIYSGQGGYNWSHQARTDPYIDFTGLRVGDAGSAAAAAGTPFMEAYDMDPSSMTDAEFKEWYDTVHIPAITEAFEANRDKVISDAKLIGRINDAAGNRENFLNKITSGPGSSYLSDDEIFKIALEQTTDGKIGSWHVAPWETEEGGGGEEEEEGGGGDGGGNTGGGEEDTEKETPGCPCKDGTTRPECCKEEPRNLWPLAGLATLAGLTVPKGNYKAARLTQPVTTRQANLPRVNYNAARSESANMNTAARRFAGNQLSGPAGAAYAAMSDQNARAQSLKISDAEAKQNKDLMDREATLNAGIRAKNASEINATSKANADRMQRTDEFRFEQDLINRKYKADTISQTAKDIMQYRSDERLARATDDTGSYMRFLMENPDIFRNLVGAPPVPSTTKKEKTTSAKNGGYISKLNKVKKRK